MEKNKCKEEELRRRGNTFPKHLKDKEKRKRM
jgi:hypothetical protein